MIARATLALILAGPVLASGLAAGTQSASAATLTRKTGTHAGQPPQRSAQQQRRGRAYAHAATPRPSRRGLPPAIVATLDDGLAYDTPRDPQGRPVRTGAWQVGTASWYGGSQWQGRRMSDGTRYDQDELTAAHLSLPLGSRVRVTLVDEERSVVVRITDRPGTHRRVIDLSRKAAAQLGMLSRGVATVRLDPL